MQDIKKSIRNKTLKLRSSLSDETRILFSKNILENLLASDTINKSVSFSCYMSVRDEVITDDIIKMLIDLNKSVFVPVVTSATELTFTPYSPEIEKFSKSFNLAKKRKIYPSSIPEVSLIPTVAASITGNRIGYGRGYYDRWLAKNPKTEKIALAFNCQLSDKIVPEDHDQRMDKIITETEIINCTTQSG